MADSAVALQAQNITCTRGYRDLFSELSFTVEAGQVLRVEGENGSGKTSLLRILAGLAQPVSGEVLWQGRKIRDPDSGYFNDLLYLGHKPGIKFELTAIENLCMSRALMGSHGDGDTDIEDALDQVGLYGFEDIPCGMLSAGQKRRVALAQLYLTRARLWILDEPYTSLDVNAVAKLELRFEQHVNAGGILLITSHQPVTLNNCNVHRLRLPDATLERVA